MILELESGEILEMPGVKDLARIEREEFAILFQSEGTYLQCAERGLPPWDYLLEYQIETTDQHYQAVDGPIDFPRVIQAFEKYLTGDETWKTDFRWEKMDLP